MLVYVDDLFITGSDDKLIKQLKIILMEHFKIKDLGPPTYFLGILVERSEDGICINQRKYVLELIVDAGLLGEKPSMIPMSKT